ncbi:MULTISPECIES: PASTA domain-containing protein [Myroides]|uniref:PASTA domain-containing protein n=1 Tax=Myroides albus TaxID=2562892 RepID=A0A6I3LJU8_9FLAO|nr:MULTISPECIES: PASTA domain-containing protein [Myroides]MTG98117.1 PASTA domain-containing protein [Myroides albus]MVX35523.1 PASTA domain-containing protein [Myroides sp. LoEW2-1]UVD78604.1 PASTA domain-containing protein [Myroides albus]
MKLLKFFTSKAFWVSVIVAVLLVVIGAYLALQWLGKTTNHDQKIAVPNIGKLTSEQAIKVLEESKLQMVVLDTLDFDKNVPPLSIVEQDPKANSFVKENRKIYVKINAATYKDVIVPNLSELTYRQALTTIVSLGLKEGKKSYRTYIGKDVVLQVLQNGKELKQGDRIKKNSVIDFVLGDGRATLSEEELDVAPEIE